jgi:hypothetical protein
MKEFERKYKELENIYWKSVLAERERKAAIIKAQKYLADFRRGKIAGVLV